MNKKVIIFAALFVSFGSFAKAQSIDDQIDIACGSAQGGYHALKKNNPLLNAENPANAITQPVLDAFNYVVEKNPSLVNTTPSKNDKSCKSLLTTELKRMGQYQ